MNEINDILKSAPYKNNLDSSIEQKDDENSKIIINALLNQITNNQNNQTEKNDFNESLPVFLYEFFIFELYTPSEIFKTLHQPILALRLLDFPTLSIEGKLDSQKQSVIFNQGKSSLFEMELEIIKDYLINEPLYIMFIDFNNGDMNIIGSSRVNISIFNNEHFLSKPKFLPKPRRNLLKLFDKNQTIVAEFDISLLIKREFFKYDTKKEILEKLNIDQEPKITKDDITKSKTIDNIKKNSKNIEQSMKISNNNFVSANYDIPENNNEVNEEILEDYINHNYNSAKNFSNAKKGINSQSYSKFNPSNNLSSNFKNNNNYNSVNPNFFSAKVNFHKNSNFFSQEDNENYNFNNNHSANEVNQIYNPNKEHIQNLLNPSQGKSFVSNLKDLLDGFNKQPPPLYFNNRQINIENYCLSNHEDNNNFYIRNSNQNFYPKNLGNNNIHPNGNFNLHASYNGIPDNFVIGNIQGDRNNNFFTVTNKNENDLQANISENSNNNYKNADKSLDSNNNSKGQQKIFSASYKDDVGEYDVQSREPEKMKVRLKIDNKRYKNDFSNNNTPLNRKNNNDNVKDNFIEAWIENKNNNSIKEIQNSYYVKQPKMIQNKSFIKQKEKKTQNFINTKIDNYDKIQKGLVSGSFKDQEENNESGININENDISEASKIKNLTKKYISNELIENNEENEYIKLYSKIKSEKKIVKNKDKIKKEKDC